jgi:hypothetical protein
MKGFLDERRGLLVRPSVIEGIGPLEIVGGPAHLGIEAWPDIGESGGDATLAIDGPKREGIGIGEAKLVERIRERP